MLKILHTSDWHIGKQLHKISLLEDIQLFFDFLIQTVQKEKVDVVIMSGDLFDHANPSAQAQKSYYEFLKKMLPLHCKIIITGGNHDSPHVLNAPKSILDALEVTVIGGITDDISELFIPFEKNGNKVVFAAVPFIRDHDLRKAAPGESYQDKITQLQEGLKQYFEAINTYHRKHFAEIPLITLAHLFVQGSELSDSERSIQIGNQAGVGGNIFGTNPSYVALGHIHKAQKIKEHVRYCGSPIPLSFSERKDEKKMLLLALDQNKLNVQDIPIPSFRKLIRLKGNLASVQSKIEDFKSSSVLPDLIELEIEEENENTQSIQDLNHLVQKYQEESDFHIVNAKIHFKNQSKGSASFLKKDEDIADFTPLQMFKKRLEMEEDHTLDDELILAFKELHESCIQNA